MLEKDRTHRRHTGNARLALVAGLLAAGLASSPRSATPEEKLDKEAAAKGRTTFERYCVSCHGPKAQGDGPLAKDLRVPVPDLTTLAKRNGGTYPYDRVVRLINKGGGVRGHGTDDMPAWGTAFRRTGGIEASVDDAIRNTSQYLWSLQRE